MKQTAGPYQHVSLSHQHFFSQETQMLPANFECNGTFAISVSLHVLPVFAGIFTMT